MDVDAGEPETRPLNWFGASIVGVFGLLIVVGVVACILAAAHGAVGAAFFFGLMAIGVGAYTYVRVFSIPRFRRH